MHFEAVKRGAAPTSIAQYTPTPLPQQATVDFGKLKRWAVDSIKTYSATRFFTTGGKIVTMRLGRRARVSQVRTGYGIRTTGMFELAERDAKFSAEVQKFLLPQETLRAAVGGPRDYDRGA